MTTNFFTTFQIGWLNAWIPSFAMVIIQYLFMIIYKEGGKRAVDTSWYDKRDKISAFGSTVLQVLLLIVSIFIPLKMGTMWFWIGTAIYIFSFIAFIAAFYAYAKAPADKIIQNGIYKYSRNPMYAVFLFGMLGVVIASTSLWLLLLLIPFAVFMHFTILGEERFCRETYGEDYAKYMKKVRRYL